MGLGQNSNSINKNIEIIRSNMCYLEFNSDFFYLYVNFMWYLQDSFFLI
jgi:hypothetical protein